MKKLAPLLLSFLLFTVLGKAQYITIPDSVFQRELKQLYPSCFNSSGMMDTTCTAIVTADSLVISNPFNPNAPLSEIQNLAGIEAFKSLKYLNCSYNGIIINPVSPMFVLPNSITYLICISSFVPDDNYLPYTFLPALPSSLIYLNCSSNTLLSSLPNIIPSTLKYLNCSDDDIGALQPLPNTLTYLDCSNQLANLDEDPEYILTSLPNPLPDSLKFLNCSSNDIGSLPALPKFLDTLICDNMVAGFSESEDNGGGPPTPVLFCLPALPTSLTSLTCDTTIKCLLNFVPGLKVQVDINGTPTLETIPVCDATNNPHQCPFYSAGSVNVQLCPPTANTTITSNLTGSSYQWQLNTGSGFTNVLDGSDYDSSTTASLNLFNIPSSSYGYQYRCIVGTDTSATYTIQFVDSWTGAVSSAWENPANWLCYNLPDSNTDVIINDGLTNYPVLSSNASVRSLTVNPSASTIESPYTLTVTH